MNLVIDRTLDDVIQCNAKGQYGFEDLNRVEQAVDELQKVVRSLGVEYTAQVKTDWALPGVFSADQWPTELQMQRYLGNVTRLCEAVEVSANVPASMEKLDWQGANKIEEALQLVYMRIQNILAVLRYSGEFYSGEENVI